MPLWIADYRADTAHLGALEHGIYLLLIMHYWQTGGLPDDDKQLARIACATSAEWKRARPVVEKFFKPGWKHGRIEEELAEAARLSAAGKKGGTASGEARRARTINERSFNDPPTNGEAPHSQPPSPSSFKTIGEVRANPRKDWTPPKHGACGKGRVYIEFNSPEWRAYAEDFRCVTGSDPVPNSHGGKWFKTLGEAAE